jgi:tRNA(Ile)-lysidine synthase
MLRSFLKEQGLRAPSETKLAEMLRQITRARRGGNVRFAHDGKELRVYRDKVIVKSAEADLPFERIRWTGQSKLALPGLGGELIFRATRGAGIDRSRLESAEVTVRLRSGGERLQVDSQRPRRTLKNLFQEAGIPPWERVRMPLLFAGPELVWAPGLGVDARYRAKPGAPGVAPRWKK